MASVLHGVGALVGRPPAATVAGKRIAASRGVLGLCQTRRLQFKLLQGWGERKRRRFNLQQVCCRAIVAGGGGGGGGGGGYGRDGLGVFDPLGLGDAAVFNLWEEALQGSDNIMQASGGGRPSSGRFSNTSSSAKSAAGSSSSSSSSSSFRLLGTTTLVLVFPAGNLHKMLLLLLLLLLMDCKRIITLCGFDSYYGGQFCGFWRFFQRKASPKVSIPAGMARVVQSGNLHPIVGSGQVGFCWQLGSKQPPRNTGHIFWREHWAAGCFLTRHCPLHQCTNRGAAAGLRVSKAPRASEEGR